MGFGTYLISPIYFSKETYQSRYQVEKDLKNVRNSIADYKATLKSLVLITEPQKFCPKDENPLSWIQEYTDEILEALEWLYVDEYKLSMLLDAWDKCHDKNNNGIVPAEPLKIWDMYYCGGDFIKEVYPDGTKVENDID